MTTQTPAVPAVFSFANAHKVRVVVINGDPWFVATDVCAALEIGNVSQALTRLDDDEKQTYDSATLISNEGTSVNNLLNIINESGMYSLVLGCRKPSAKAFKKWVTSEVLPSIRKTGRYVHPNAPQPHEVAEEYITSSQYFELKTLVYRVSCLFHRERSAANAIWAMLRRELRAVNAAQIAITRFDDAKRLIADAEKFATEYHDQAVAAENRLFKSRFRALPSDLDCGDAQHMLPI